MVPNNKQNREAREARARVRGYQARRAVHEFQQKRRVRDNVLAAVGLGVVLVFAVGAQLFFFNGGPGTPVPSPTAAATGTPTPTPSATPGANTGKVPSSTLAKDRTWTGTMSLNKIPLGISLDGALAPQAVSSTIHLIQTGFYTGVPCHRLTTSGIFVLQCGDPTGKGTGGPGYSYGPIENAPKGDVYPAGTIAMARSTGNAYSMGSQFFIVYKDTTIPSDAAGGYTVLGKVTSGLGQLTKKITDAGVKGGAADGAPAVATTITDVSVR